MSKRARNAIIGAVSAVALATTALIQPWEGRELKAYRDIVGVWTICDGETKGVKPGMVVTAEWCDQRTRTRVENDYHQPLRVCIKDFDDAPLSWRAAMISLSYNVGVGAACEATAARLARSKMWADSCQAMTRFNRAGGKVIRGLVLRRTNGDATRIGERELCLAGLPK